MAWKVQKKGQEKMADIRVAIPDSIHEKLKQIAEDEGIELAEAVRQALAYSVRHYKKAAGNDQGSVVAAASAK